VNAAARTVLRIDMGSSVGLGVDLGGGRLPDGSLVGGHGQAMIIDQTDGIDNGHRYR